jgi:hypothetical protein
MAETVIYAAVCPACGHTAQWTDTAIPVENSNRTTTGHRIKCAPCDDADRARP